MHCTGKLFRLFWGTVIVLSLQVGFFSVPDFASTGGPDMLVQQLHRFNVTPPLPYSTVGMVTLFYTPEVTGYYINIVALDKTEQPQWIVRNLYIPDYSWIAREQTISKRFCLQSLGFVPGEPVPLLEMAVCRSETVRTVMPIPEAFTPTEVDTIRDDAQGDDTLMSPTEPSLEEYPRFPDFFPEDQIIPIEFRGCRVPNIDLDDLSFPDSDEYAGDQNACGPASAANSLHWLDSAYAEITIPEPLRMTMEELSDLMARARNGGVTIESFIRGKLDYIEAHDLPINVKFQSHSIIAEDVISSTGMFLARNDNTGPYPTWDWLRQQMADSEDVEIMYYWWDGEAWRGHAVVLTGLEESLDGSKKSIKFKHDICQGLAGGTVQEDESIYIDSYGRMILRSRGAFIGNAVAESPGDPFVTPVELGMFAAELHNNDVQLVWKTETESNNYGFAIFRNDQYIALVPGNGTTTEPHNYSYLDTGLTPGSYQYDLFQLDFDGTKEKLGSTTVVLLNKAVKFSLSQNYPNPFNATTKIRYTIPENAFVSVKIYNMSGEEVASLVNEQQQAGVYTIDFDASHLANGIYFYRMEAADFSRVRKFLLVK